jgi:hypothetical protein
MNLGLSCIGYLVAVLLPVVCKACTDLLLRRPCDPDSAPAKQRLKGAWPRSEKAEVVGRGYHCRRTRLTIGAISPNQNCIWTGNTREHWLLTDWSGGDQSTARAEVLAGDGCERRALIESGKAGETAGCCSWGRSEGGGITSAGTSFYCTRGHAEGGRIVPAIAS